MGVYHAITTTQKKLKISKNKKTSLLSFIWGWANRPFIEKTIKEKVL
jgi:hypothetical protein